MEEHEDSIINFDDERESRGIPRRVRFAITQEMRFIKNSTSYPMLSVTNG